MSKAIRPVSIAFVAASLLPALLAAWVLWLAPLADISADRAAVAARDFTALWAAGRLAGENATHLLADPALFTARLRDWFGPAMPDQIWPYPPPTLFLAALVAQLPLAWSFPLYTVLTPLLLWTVLRLARLPRPLCALALLSPAIADNALIGQNGALTAALLAGGLLLLPTRPALAGLLLGGLVLKPQLAVLLPFSLIAGRQWRAGLVALCVGLALTGLSCLCFGTQAWVDYLLTARPAITAYVEAPWTGDGAQRIFASAFIAARSLGAGLPAAYAVQALVTALCAILAIVAWRRPAANPWHRVCLTIALTAVASPWVHSYDMPAMAVAIVLLIATGAGAHRPLLAFAWFWPGAALTLALPNPLLVLSSASVAWLAWRADGQTVDHGSWRSPGCASSAS